MFLSRIDFLQACNEATRRVANATRETNYADHSYPCPRCVKYLARHTERLHLIFSRNFLPRESPVADLGLRLEFTYTVYNVHSAYAIPLLRPAVQCRTI